MEFLFHEPPETHGMIDRHCVSVLVAILVHVEKYQVAAIDSLGVADVRKPCKLPCRTHRDDHRRARAGPVVDLYESRHRQRKIPGEIRSALHDPDPDGAPLAYFVPRYVHYIHAMPLCPADVSGLMIGLSVNRESRLSAVRDTCYHGGNTMCQGRRPAKSNDVNRRRPYDRWRIRNTVVH